MIQEVNFQGAKYKLILTKHALERMEERRVSRGLIIEVIETGKAIEKNKKGRWWIYKEIKLRTDNNICLSVTIESPHLILITTLINWRPKP